MSEAESKRLHLLHPEVGPRVIQLFDVCRKNGMRLFLGSTLRTISEQAKLKADGKSTLKVGWHCLGRAADIYPYVRDKMDNFNPDFNGTDVAAFREMQKEAMAIGFRQIGFNPDWTKHYIMTTKGKVWDAGHVEWRAPYATLADAVKAEGAEHGL